MRAGADRKAFNNDVRALVERRYGRGSFSLPLETKLFVLEKVSVARHADALRCACSLEGADTDALGAWAGALIHAPHSPLCAIVLQVSDTVPTDPAATPFKPRHMENLFGV